MKKIILLIWIILALTPEMLISQNAPISTVGTIVSNSATVTVPVMATNFSNIVSFNLRLLYNHTVLSISSVTAGPLLSGNLATDITHLDTISLGWFAYPAVTLPDNSVIFNINCTQVTGGCTSAITWSTDGYCVWYGWYDNNILLLNDAPASTYYLNGSVTFAFPLVADFIAGNTTPPKYTDVQLTDLTTGCPSNWAWSFDRTSVIYVNGTNAQSQNPQVQFTDGGLYTVTLIVNNAYYTDRKIKTGYIRAGIPGLWTGNTSSDWMILSNWDNYLVPDITTDIVIPSPAPNWPQFTGNLTVGSDCKSITLNGPSQAFITGNFTISAGSSLNFTNNGILQVGGNWVNNGSFTSGSGTVDFTGANPASILPGTPPTILNIFYNLKVSKTPAKLTIVPNITVNGDLLINP